MSFSTPLVGAVLSAATLLVVLYINFVRPWWRSYKLRVPIRAYFTIDGGEEETNNIELPANSQCEVQLRILPLTSFRCDLLKFGFHGDVATRPLPLSVHNSFVKRGASRQKMSPDTNANHYIDIKDAYNIIQDSQEYTEGNHKAIGFVVQTRAPGRFKVKLLLATEAGEGRALMDLFVTVLPETPKLSG